MATSGTYVGNSAYMNNANHGEGMTYDPSVNLGSNAYQYKYTFGDWLSGAMAAGRQAEALCC